MYVMLGRILKHCLVTGGAGFIGSHLTNALIKNVIGQLLLTIYQQGIENLSDVMDEITFIKGDIRDIDLLKTF